MKNYIGIIISLALTLVGAIGAIICITPSVSQEYKVVDKYVSAVNDCDLEAMQECMPLNEVSQALGIDMGDYSGTPAAGSSDKLSFLKLSGFNVGGLLPEGVKSVKDISLISLQKSAGTADSLLSSAAAVEGVIKVTYITAEDETACVTDTQVFTLVRTDTGFKIIG